MATCIDSKSFEKVLSESIREAIIKESEPIIQRAIKDVEVSIRKALANHIMVLIEQNMSIERVGPDIRITVQHRSE